jgi:HEAT repeat protein
MLALVTLDAKDQTPSVARVLKDRFKGGQAAKTLALLGADKYAKDIAGLLAAEDLLTRADALVALGILRAVAYAPEVAKRMRDKDDSVRHAAAWSIVMMGAKAYAAEAIEVQKSAEKEKLSPMGSTERGIPRDRLRQLEKEFANSYAEMKRSRGAGR